MESRLEPAGLWAGTAQVDVTDRDAGPANDPLYVKVLALKSRETAAVIVTVDAVAIAEIGGIRNTFLDTVRKNISDRLSINPLHIVVNASHCHGAVRADIDRLTIEAIHAAWSKMIPVRASVGAGYEDRIMENRRLNLRSGGQGDMRHAYSLPPDGDVTGAGPVDPEIGILRLDQQDGRPLAVVYNFAVHPIQTVPNRANTADITGFASRVIQENLGEGTVVLFLQGCGGDVNPALYKDTNNPRDAELWGNLLGLSTLKALRKLEPSASSEDDLRIINETIDLPRADHASRIAEMEEERRRLLDSLAATSLSFKTFLPLWVKHGLSPEYPSYDSHRYLSEAAAGREGLRKLDDENRRGMTQYLHNIQVMEELIRIRVNLDLLRKHHHRNRAAASDTVPAEVVGLRVGEFRLVTFPGEMSVQTGLDIKQKSPYPRTFLAGVTNGYLYYTPTAEQLANTRASGAQEDCECVVDAGWEKIFEAKALEVLRRLE